MVMLNTNEKFSGSLVELVQVPIPEIAIPFDVPIRVAAALVCRTDLRHLGGLLSVRHPTCLDRKSRDS